MTPIDTVKALVGQAHDQSLDGLHLHSRDTLRLVIELLSQMQRTPQVEPKKHIFQGDCPDENQPDAFDSECPACVALQSHSGHSVTALRTPFQSVRTSDDVSGPYSVEPHGNGWAIYKGRDFQHHGLNLGQLTETGANIAELVERALNCYARASLPRPSGPGETVAGATKSNEHESWTGSQVIAAQEILDIRPALANTEDGRIPIGKQQESE